jgi:hypothetical protein
MVAKMSEGPELGKSAPPTMLIAVRLGVSEDRHGEWGVVVSQNAPKEVTHRFNLHWMP